MIMLLLLKVQVVCLLHNVNGQKSPHSQAAKGILHNWDKVIEGTIQNNILVVERSNRLQGGLEDANNDLS